METSFKEALLAFELKIRRKVIYNTHDIAVGVIKQIQNSLKHSKTNSETEKVIRFVTDHLTENFPNDVIIRNVCEQVILKLDEEADAFRPNKAKTIMSRSQSKRTFIQYMIPETSEEISEEDQEDDSLKSVMSEILDSISTELGRSYEGIAQNAPDYIHANDIILTLGWSQSVINFLTNQVDKNPSLSKITVIVPERAPEYDGVRIAQKLREKKISVIVIPDSAIFAILPKVNTVILPARSVMANGGITAYSLSHSVALAAKHYSKPVIVLYWEMKLTREMYHPGEWYTTLRQPNQIIDKQYPAQTNIIAINPEGDYIPPELITLMINENKPHCPGDVFSIVQANYYGEER